MKEQEAALEEERRRSQEALEAQIKLQAIDH